MNGEEKENSTQLNGKSGKKNTQEIKLRENHGEEIEMKPKMNMDNNNNMNGEEEIIVNSMPPSLKSGERSIQEIKLKEGPEGKLTREIKILTKINKSTNGKKEMEASLTQQNGKSGRKSIHLMKLNGKKGERTTQEKEEEVYGDNPMGIHNHPLSQSPSLAQQYNQPAHDLFVLNCFLNQIIK